MASYRSKSTFELLASIYDKFRNSLESRLAKSSPICEIDGVKIHGIGQHLSATISQSIASGSYEQAEIEILKSYLSPEDIVMEIGAGIGFLSAYCAKKIGSDRVFAYEANPNLGDVIRSTYQLNNVVPTIEVCMVGAETRMQDFYITKDFWSSSFVKPMTEEIVDTISVAMKSFNDEVQKINPSLLVVDIEGGEYQLFENADLHNIQKIIIELHNSIIGTEKIEFVKNKLNSAGFQTIEVIPNCEDEILFLQRVSQ